MIRSHLVSSIIFLPKFNSLLLWTPRFIIQIHKATLNLLRVKMELICIFVCACVIEAEHNCKGHIYSSLEFTTGAALSVICNRMFP